MPRGEARWAGGSPRGRPDDRASGRSSDGPPSTRCSLPAALRDRPVRHLLPPDAHEEATLIGEFHGRRFPVAIGIDAARDHGWGALRGLGPLFQPVEDHLQRFAQRAVTRGGKGVDRGHGHFGRRRRPTRGKLRARWNYRACCAAFRAYRVSPNSTLLRFRLATRRNPPTGPRLDRRECAPRRGADCRSSDRGVS
jgi:hypothetical protein